MPDNKKKPKLHELVAVRPGARSQADKCRQELAETFEKRQHHFVGTTRTFTANTEDAVAKVEEDKPLQTTVRKELAWITPFLAKAIDATNRVNVGNTMAVADIVLENDHILVGNIAGTTLLELEDIVDELRRFVDRIPTLDPAKGYTQDTTQPLGTYIGRTVEKTRHNKKNVPVVLYQHTDKHPAQVQLVVEDVPVGKILETEWSGMLTIEEKGRIKERIDELARCVKRARSRANDTEVNLPPNIGKTIIDYAFAGLNSGETAQA